jgi:16S rRNA (guanine966-N2)-methyltransferase
MRIIAGEFRSRRLKTLPGMALRPTSDRLRETLFNVLSDAVRGAVFVDCYAGSGAVGLEALSRGASQAIFIEQFKGSLGVLRDNIATLGVERRARVIEGPASKGLQRIGDPQIVFLDPPYAAAEEYRKSLEALVGSGALIVVEHAARDKLVAPEGLSLQRFLPQGDSALSFFAAISH